MPWQPDDFPPTSRVNAIGHRQVDATVELGPVDVALCGPEKRTRQTAELLGLRAKTDPRLADLDCGAWRGTVLGGVPPADLAVWLTEPAQAPHGGESVVDLIQPGARLAGLGEQPPRPTGRRHPPLGDPCGDPGGARCAAKIVLAHRRWAGQPHGAALPRAGLDAAVDGLNHPTGMSPNACFAIDSSHSAAARLRYFCQFSWKLTTHAWPVRSSAYQLKVRSPGRFPPLAPM